jgi:cystathionine beta-lyase
VIHDFEQVINRCGTDSVKWCHFPPEALPLWVADMDFRAPEPVIQVLQRRVEHGVFGYGAEPCELRDVLVARLQAKYGWRVAPDTLIFLPGVVRGFNLACQALTTPGDGVMLQTPAYPPILHAPSNAQCTSDEMELTRSSDGSYTVDFERFEATMSPRTRIFLLCNPHNPVGRVFTRPELECMAELCLKNQVIIVSDEIHCEFVYPGHSHIPIAALSPEVEQHTITLLAPSKTYNIAGLHCAVAVVPNEHLRETLKASHRGLLGEPDILSYTATLAAYRDCQGWLDDLLVYLRANRDFAYEYIQQSMSGVSMVRPEGTYLAWLDCCRADISGNPQRFFLERANVALNDGADYGRGGEGFVRLNFGCPRTTLLQALERMEQALREAKGEA